jgi:hypothetical protein
MPERCVQRPNRAEARPFTSTKLAKLLCRWVREGNSRAAFELEFEKVCPDEGQRRGNAAAEALAVAQVALEQTDSLFDADLLALTRFLNVFILVGILNRLVLRFLGAPGKLLSVAVILAERAAVQRVKDVTVQKAANDAALEIVRRVAANEARFLQRVGSR